MYALVRPSEPSEWKSIILSTFQSKGKLVLGGLHCNPLCMYMYYIGRNFVVYVYV